MTLFQTIHALARDTTLVMTFATNPQTDTLIVTVMPKSAGENANPALSQWMKFEATPEDLDEGFAQALTSYATKRRTLADALKDAEAVMDAAKKAAGEKATKAVQGTAKKAQPATAVATTPAVNAVEPLPGAEAGADENLFA